MLEIDDIRKLSPKERIQRLKKLEEQRKREIEQAETLISESMVELTEEEEKKQIPIPQVKAAEISDLATAEEKQIYATKRFVELPQSAVEEVKEAPRLEEVAEQESETESSKKAREESGFKGYGGPVEKAKSEHEPMRIYRERRSVTKADSDEEEVYQSRSVTRADGEKNEDVYRSRSVSGMDYELNEKGEEKTKGMYK